MGYHVLSFYLPLVTLFTHTSFYFLPLSLSLSLSARPRSALDFSYHLLKVQRVDGSDKVVRGIPIKRMVDRIRRFQVLNSQILSTLNKYLTSSSPPGTGQVEHVKCFQPPLHPAVASQGTLPQSF